MSKSSMCYADPNEEGQEMRLLGPKPKVDYDAQLVDYKHAEFERENMEKNWQKYHMQAVCAWCGKIWNRDSQRWADGKKEAAIQATHGCCLACRELNFPKEARP